MFRPMRRSAQALDGGACVEILERGTSGVLAVAGDGGWPYAVPLSYAFDGEKLYFHCAREGHKLDAIRREARASFCVVDRDDVKPAEYTSYFRSVIIFGRVRVLEDEAQKRAAIELLARRYFPEDSAENRRRAIEREWAGLCMLEMDIEHMSGKEAKELAREGGSKQ
ncbi:MAG TPA: pyridoxamine 5'-phosphate oxidase family protein [Candidatus Pullichristensenella stercoripullorum]|nr:pyridoxamine 5'-phosphate oxidase family protein [Candidatus Pullichristensenella stercoripullorum]